MLWRFTISAGVGLVSAVSAILSRLTRIEHGPSVVGRGRGEGVKGVGDGENRGGGEDEIKLCACSTCTITIISYFGRLT